MDDTPRRISNDESRTEELRSEIAQTRADMSETIDAIQEKLRPGNIAAWNGPYLKGGTVPPDPWGNAYVYRAPGQEGRTYDLLSYGADGTEGGTGAACGPA